MRFVRGVAALVLLTSTVHADPIDPKVALADQLVAELQTLDKTLATVDDKVSAAELARLKRMRAAYRILRTPVTVNDSDETAAADRMSSARRRAAARLLLERDRSERQLLADEAAQLRTAETTLRSANDQVPTLAAPPGLQIPPKATIARRFGTLVHDRSKATLARRGIDFDVPALTAALAPADGIVRYAGPMRGLDNGVIVDHGDYFSVVAKLADVVIPVGARVVRGDRIGRAARQRVYLELRAKIGPGGLPIDPEPLLAR